MCQKRKLYVSAFLLLAIISNIICSNDEMVLSVSKLTDVDDDDDEDNTNNNKSAFDTIADVNPETANLMPDNFNRQSSGLFEYDIMLNDWSHQKVFGPDPNRQNSAPSSNFDRLWPNGKVYYTYDNTIAGESSGKTLSIIEQAMKVYQEKTCIKFFKRTTEDHYIEFHKGSGCWSLIGRTGGKQQISLGYGCEQIGVAIHEMLHALGFWHEQSRPDRDDHVTIVFDNIKTGMKDQFKRYDNEISAMGSKYDYLSIMHYGDTAFSIDPQTKKTILVKDSSFTGKIGQRNGLSVLDIEQINKLYKCGGGSTVVDGNWGSWSSWSVCDHTCGGGYEIRSRSCDSPSPSNGGKTCSEKSVETKSCNTAACPVPIECNFDQSFCLWQNLGNEEMDWQRISGLTPSSKTGPQTDHTTRTGSYIYIETSAPKQNGDRAILQSSVLSGTNYYRCFKFYYHMFGVNVNSLYVYLKYGNVLSLLWKLEANQGDQWHEANVQIAPSQSDIQILLMGVRGDGYQGDISLDDFSITASYCNVKPINARVVDPATTTTTTTTTTTVKPIPRIYDKFLCSFDSTSAQCQWRNMNSYDTMDWTVNSGPTISAGTGPSSGTYAYLEGSNPAVIGDNAWLISPDLPDITNSNPKCFRFDYHMYGDGIGELNVYFYNPEKGTLNKYWTLKGNQGNIWQKANVQISDGAQQKIIIEAIRGFTFTSDIAIDNLEVIDGSCTLKPATALIQADETVKPSTSTPTETNDKVIKIEVTSEGCGDPAVRRRTVAKQRGKKRSTRSLLGWKDFFNKAKKAAKKLIKDVKKQLEEDETGTYQNIIDAVNKRVISYIQKKFPGFEIKTSIISPSTGSNVNGMVTINNDCSLAKSSILINGVETSMGKPGHNVVVVDGKTGKVLFKKWYDTKSHGLAATTAGSDLKKLPDDSIIVIATQDSVLPQFIGETELQKIGAVPPFLPGPQGSWAFIGYKGKRKVDWIKQISHSKGTGPSIISATISLMTKDNANVSTTPTTPGFTAVTIIKDEVQLRKFKFITIPLHWSNRLNFGNTDFTVSLSFQTSQDGTLFSKVQPYLTTYSDDIKTVYIEGSFLHVKLTSGHPLRILKRVTDGVWHHVVITVKQRKSSDILRVYIDGVPVLTKLLQTTVDLTDTLVNVGKTVKKFPGKTYFNGRIKDFIYTTRTLNEIEARKLSTAVNK